MYIDVVAIPMQIGSSGIPTYYSIIPTVGIVKIATYQEENYTNDIPAGLAWAVQKVYTEPILIYVGASSSTAQQVCCIPEQVNRIYSLGLYADPDAMWSLPVTGKVWNRIKGFFKKVWKFVKGVAPVVQKIAPAILPGPYGAVAAGIAGAVDTAASAISVIAAKKTVAALEADGQPDVLEITPQVHIATSLEAYSVSNTNGLLDPTNSSDVGWDSGETITVPVNEVSTVSAVRQLAPLVAAAVANGGLTGATPYVQQRLKVHFKKTGPLVALK